MKILEPYSSGQDARGTFTGIINSGTWEEINILTTVAGQVRGGHYHKWTLELFYIIRGEIQVEIVSQDNGREVVLVGEGSILLIEPYETHTFRCLSDCAWINALSKRMDDNNKDFFT